MSPSRPPPRWRWSRPAPGRRADVEGLVVTIQVCGEDVRDHPVRPRVLLRIPIGPLRGGPRGDLHHAAAAEILYADVEVRGEAEEERVPSQLSRVQTDAHRQTLHDLDPVPRRI